MEMPCACGSTCVWLQYADVSRSEKASASATAPMRLHKAAVGVCVEWASASATAPMRLHTLAVTVCVEWVSASATTPMR